jgi:hypothetical protein
MINDDEGVNAFLHDESLFLFLAFFALRPSSGLTRGSFAWTGFPQPGILGSDRYGESRSLAALTVSSRRTIVKKI